MNVKYEGKISIINCIVINNFVNLIGKDLMYFMRYYMYMPNANLKGDPDITQLIPFNTNIFLIENPG